MRVTKMGAGAKRSYDKLVSVIQAGRTTVCYDGQNFFDTDHQEGKSPTQSNLFTSTALCNCSEEHHHGYGAVPN